MQTLTQIQYRDLAMNAQKALNASQGKGFRSIPEHSNQLSIVEKYLVKAGDMTVLPSVPTDRMYRRKRRPRPEVQPGTTMVFRHMSAEPSQEHVKWALDNFKKVKSRAELLLAMTQAMGYTSLSVFEAQASRAERFMRSLKKTPNKRLPKHIRFAYAAKRLIELTANHKFGETVQPA